MEAKFSTHVPLTAPLVHSICKAGSCYMDRTEANSGHPSIINSMSRVCLGTEEFCTYYYHNHFWYSNLDVKKYEKMAEKIQVICDNHYAKLSGGSVK